VQEEGEAPGTRRPSAAPRGPVARVGTSGWSYRHWSGPFYPPGLSPRRWLQHYARLFRTVEINSSFYHPLSVRAVQGWAQTVPEGFVFAVKASRVLTHFRKLNDPLPVLEPFLATLEPLGTKLGPLLFQLPPRWRVDPARLEAFLRVLPPALRCAFEFRDPSWFDDRVYALLARHGAAFCVYHLRGLLSPVLATAGFAYLRLHGPAGAYAGLYGAAELSGWARAVEGWLGEGRDVYVYFDNDERGFAARNARELAERLPGAVPSTELQAPSPPSSAMAPGAVPAVSADRSAPPGPGGPAPGAGG